jgi:hypothetical protein
MDVVPPGGQRRRRLPRLSRLVSPAVAVLVAVGASAGAAEGVAGSPAPDWFPRPAELRSTVADPGPVHVAEEGSYDLGPRDANGRPTRWDPCTPVPVMINPEGAPDGAVADMVAALAMVTDASGLPFRYDGLTEVRPTPDYLDRRDDGYPEGPPVLIAWVTPESGLLQEGEAGKAYRQRMGHRYTGAMVLINAGSDARFEPGFGRRWARGGLYLHELGHVAGLDHVDDPDQVMHPEVGQHWDLGDGDRAGLRALRADACLVGR